MHVKCKSSVPVTVTEAEGASQCQLFLGSAGGALGPEVTCPSRHGSVLQALPPRPSTLGLLAAARIMFRKQT